MVSSEFTGVHVKKSSVNYMVRRHGCKCTCSCLRFLVNEAGRVLASRWSLDILFANPKMGEDLHQFSFLCPDSDGQVGFIQELAMVTLFIVKV